MKKSLLRYPGGKTRAVKTLKDYIPKGTKQVCSPFFGGGSFELYMSSIGIDVFGYDVFNPLVHFWQQLLINPKMLHEEVAILYPLSRDKFYAMQKEILIIDNPIKIAAYYYVLNRSSFSGTGLSGGMSPSHPRFGKNQIDNILKFDAKFHIENLSFNESILNHDCFVYADPPYMIKQALYGNKGNTHKGFDHKLLSDILNSRLNFLLSYNDCEEIRDMYKDHKIIEPKWSYGMNKTKRSNEVLIISRDLI